MKTKPTTRILPVLLLSACFTGGRLIASPVTIPDFSFENTTNITTDGGTTGAPDVGPSWTASGNGGVFLFNPMDANYVGTTGTPGTLPPPADGTNCLVLAINGHTGYCWQNVTNVQSNTVYTLTIAVGQDLISGSGQGMIALVDGVNPFGTILASAPVDSSTVTPGTFMDFTLVYTTGQHASGPLTILMQGNAGTLIMFDNVRLDATAAPAAATAVPPLASPSTNVYVGTLVTLLEDPAGALPFHYQWQSDNGTGGATFSDISGANSTNLVVDTSITGAGVVEYQVVVTNSLGSSTSAPVIITASQSQPVIIADTLPSSGSDVIGGQITFSAVFDGTRPISYQWMVQDTNGNPAVAISGATNSTYTISDLQQSDFALYSVTASNVLGTASSTPSIFAVNLLPPATNNVFTAAANQVGLGGNTEFTPSWILATNSMIAGKLPSTVGPGNFSRDASGTVAVLTDGRYGVLYPEGNGSLDFITGGTVASTAGQFVTYTLTGSATGYDLTNIVSYGGWSDAGRDEQRFTIYYSTVANPSNFTALTDVDFNPSNPNAVQSATRVSLTPASGPLAKNVAAVKFDFTPLANSAKNGYEGYCEFQLFGVASAPAPIIASDTEPGSGSDVVGGTITFSAAFSGATSLNWQVDKGTGPTNIPGATSTTLTLSNLQLTDSGTYQLAASNVSGVTMSTGCPFTVNPVPGPDGNGVVASPANQTGRGATYSPTWPIASGSLISGMLPSAIGGTGTFINEGGGGVVVLTDGVFGHVGSGDNSTMATCGVNPGGNSVTYTFTGSSSGYDLTNIMTYGGWSDGGRDQQAYTVSYSSVAAPSTFIQLTSVSYLPTIPGSVPSTTRMDLTSFSGGPMATNVAAIKFDFTNPVGENGWEGYAELSVYGSVSAPLPLPPTVTQDLLPNTGSDVVGSQVRFTTAFNGSAPIAYQWYKNSTNIPGATSSILILNNLQLTDSGSYSLQASNSLGVASTSTNSFTVNSVPAPVNGVIASPANQTDISGGFVPTWLLQPGSLIAGKLPSSVGTGNFSQEGAAGVAVLTDGVLGTSGGSLTGFATCGSGAGGHSVTYTLTGSASGYNISNITVYAGWGDNGRDQQAYTVSYSTVAAPATFNSISSVNFNPAIPGSTPTADRVILTSSTAAPIATNVASVKFDFTNPAGENGYSGYDEIQVFGSPVSQPPPTVNPPIHSGGNLILTGGGGTPGGTYSWLTSTNIATPLAQWTTNTTGNFDGTGSFSNNIAISPSDARRFFRLKTP